MTEVFLIAGFILSVLLILISISRSSNSKMDHTCSPQVLVNLKPIEEKLADLPNKILQSITASSNTHKGALGELIGYIQLKSNYDRIIPLGNIIDFMAIDLPKEGNPGKIIFIDVKTGKSARLSKEQKLVRDLIKQKSIEFLELKITDTKDML